MIHHRDLSKHPTVVLKAIRTRYFVYLQLLFCATSCSNCVDTAVYRNLASQLTLQECRDLVASLHDPSYEFTAVSKPRTASAFRSDRSESKLDPCMQLLLEWDKNAGQNSTHIFIERRLRQMGKIELADWLGRTVFHQLAKDINETLLQNPFADSNEELALNFKLLVDKTLLQVTDKLTQFDLILCVLVIILVVALIVVCCRIAWLSCLKRNSGREEEMYLIDKNDVNEN